MNRRSFLLGSAAVIGSAGLPIPKSPFQGGPETGPLLDNPGFTTDRGWVQLTSTPTYDHVASWFFRTSMDGDGLVRLEEVDPEKVYQSATIRHEADAAARAANAEWWRELASLYEPRLMERDT